MKTKPLLSISVMLSVALFGCSSFNTHVYPAPTLVVLPSTTSSAPSPVEAKIECVYIPPDSEPVPRIPIQELKSLKKDDDAALDDIQQRHIKELRFYIQMEERKHRTAYQDYLKRCAPYLRTEAKNTE